MEARGTETMVYRKYILSLLALFASTNISIAATILHIEKKMPADCENLTIAFLKELKSVSNETIFEITDSRDKSDLSLVCKKSEDRKGILLTNLSNQESVFIRYLGINAGFDSLDWLQVQRRFLTSDDDTQSVQAQNFELEEQKISAALKAEEDGKSIDRTSRIMTTSAIGGVVGALGGGLLSPNRESTLMNIGVFGLLGAATGAGIGCIHF